MSTRFIFPALLGIGLLGVTGILSANDKTDTEAIQKALSKKVLEPGQALKEMQAYCRTALVPLPQPQSVAEWEKYTTRLRKQIFDNVIYRGEAARWKDLPTEPVWFDTIPGGPGYSIRKLRFEAVPGMWVPALLYVPDKLAGKVPVVMAVNGHDRNGKSADYKQARCINLVKRGMIVLNLEWLNMGQLRSPDFGHGRMNQLDLCGTSGIAPFYLSMKRGLDILLAHPHADPKRVAVSGLSGGGWQTIFISSLDTRVTLCNPVAGYSALNTRIDHAKDLGDSEQTPVDLAKYADYTHLTALLAPRHALLTYNAKDECCFEAGYALPPLLAAAEPFYKLYGKTQNLRTHINHDPGTHNYLKENREAYYKMIGDFFYAGDKTYVYPEIPYESELKTAAQLQVILPEKNAGFNTLALQLAKNLPHQQRLPGGDVATVKTWQTARRKVLESLLQVHPEGLKSFFTAPGLNSIATLNVNTKDQASPKNIELTVETNWLITGRDEGGHHKGLSVVRTTVSPSITGRAHNSQNFTLILADKGRASVAETVLASVQNSETVTVVDIPGFGECTIPNHGWLFDLVLSSQGKRPLGVASERFLQQIMSLKSVEKERKIKVVAQGPQACLVALATVARIAESSMPDAVESLELYECPASIKELLDKNVDVENAPEFFCFGLLQEFDIVQLAALCAPTQVTFVNPSERARKELAPLREIYKTLRSDHNPLTLVPVKK